MSLKKADDDFSLNAALQFYRDGIKQQMKNHHSGYHACTVLRMLVKKRILTEPEIANLELIKLDTLPERIEAETGQLLPSTQKVYGNTAKHAIREFLGWKQNNNKNLLASVQIS